MGGRATAAVGFGQPELKRLGAELAVMCTDVFERRFGMRAWEAQFRAKRLVKRARKELREHPLLHEPPRRGRRHLERLRRTPTGLKHLDMLRAEGVREPDIIDWWDHHVLEHEVIRRIDLFEQDYLLGQFTARRIPALAAEAKIRSRMPIFGSPANSELTLGPHVPLPYELRRRVRTYLERTDQAEVRKGIDRCISMNAFLREQIKAGVF